MGGPLTRFPTVKYHYFDRFFTHSVMRNTSSPDCVGSLLGERSARRVGLRLVGLRPGGWSLSGFLLSRGAVSVGRELPATLRSRAIRAEETARRGV